MAEKPPNSRRRSPNGLTTQFDRELIMAARDEKQVDLYFSLDSVLTRTADVTGMLKVVDRYMVQFLEEDTTIPIWIQKSHLAGVVVLPA